MAAYERTYENLAVVFPSPLGSSIDAHQHNVLVSFEYDGQYGRTHDISNRLILVAQDAELVQPCRLGTVDHVVRLECVEYSGSVESSLPESVDALALYRDVASCLEELCVQTRNGKIPKSFVVSP